jgi:1-deoxy-D-xylulose-5-phosphate synthase
MSIDRNAGGLYKGLEALRKTNGAARDNMFRALGFEYFYVENGNDINALIDVFERVKNSVEPVLIHLHSLKGNGYKPAETDKNLWHWHAPFDIKTGGARVSEVKTSEGKASESAPKKVSGDTEGYKLVLNELNNNKTSAVFVAGSPVYRYELQKSNPNQYFDSGIAEQAAVSMAAGFAKGGGKPYVALQSSFVQRAYDQVAQDICINNLPVTLLIHDTGMSSQDYSHVGMFDISLLSNIPNLVYMAPSTKQEFERLFAWAKEQEFPTGLRIPMMLDDEEFSEGFGLVAPAGVAGVAGVALATAGVATAPVELGKSKLLQQGDSVAILGLGSFAKTALDVAKELESKHSIRATVIDPRFVNILDKELLEQLKDTHKLVVTLEDGVLEGGFGARIAEFYSSTDVKVLCRGAKREFLNHVTLEDSMNNYRLTPELIMSDILKFVN